MAYQNSQFYIQDGKFHKMFNSTDFIYEKERNVVFLMNNPVNHTPVIRDKIYVRQQFAGYVMDYISNAVTFREAFMMDFTYEKRLEAILDVYEALKAFHDQNLFLGDIHSDNFMIDQDGHGYILDLEVIYEEVILRLHNQSLNEYFIKLMRQEDVPYFSQLFILENHLYRT